VRNKRPLSKLVPWLPESKNFTCVKKKVLVHILEKEVEIEIFLRGTANAIRCRVGKGLKELVNMMGARGARGGYREPEEPGRIWVAQMVEEP
jgi:hypothetical protein